MPGAGPKTRHYPPKVWEIHSFISSLKDLKLLILRADGQRGVLKASVDDLSCFGRFGWKIQLCAADRTGLFGPVADCDRQVEYRILKFLVGFGMLTGDIDTYFLHDHYSAGIDSCGRNASAVSLVSISIQGPQESFRHLGAGRVVGAKEENLLFLSPGMRYRSTSMSCY